jgi:hypothetical protein
MSQLFMPITGEEKRALLNLCLVAAKQTGFLRTDENDLHGDRIMQLYKQWGGDKWAANFKPMGTEMKVEDAAANFLSWCQEKAGELAERLEAVKIEITDLTVSMHVPLGQRGFMVFAATGKPAKDPDDEMMKEFYGMLTNKVVLGYAEYIEHPPRLPTKKSYHPQSGDTAATFEFTSILCKSEGGKRSYFVKGNKFVKWGVRVWPSVLSAAGIDPETITDEKFIAGTAVYTKKSTGDPDLVIGITVGANNL